ncbi:PH domain-containing protein [Arthrobacter gandavensis]|uniref:PH domain-containing protein n=1 Tax=Arthrobacter gandavensis TaxID=169960 RepID=UPI00188E1F21|nr:PH domain-containing protein [Arthrobacter gandavensis]MBF4994669.1 PH domain-containing protein [Arthrobacter gandavensis]
MRNQAIDPQGLNWQRVSERYLTLRLLSLAAEAVITLALASIPLILRSLGIWSGFPAWLAWGLPAVFLAGFIWRGILVPRQVQAIGYAERNEDLLLRSGIFFQRTLVVPYGRMQYVDVAVGPLERLFGLCTLKLHTASQATNATIPGLPAAEGARLREHLSARGEAQLAGL